MTGYKDPPKHSQFKKGKGENRDPKINTNGRPKDFDQLRKLAKKIANEEASANGQPIIYDNQKQTQITMMMRSLMKNNPVAFLQYAYGKPKEEVDISGNVETTVKVIKGVSVDDL